MRRVGVSLVLLALGFHFGCDQIDALRERLSGSGGSAEQEPAELAEARGLYDAGEIQAATLKLEQFTRANPTSVPAFYYLGMCYLRLAGDQPDPSSDLTEAEERSRDAFRRALSLNPRHAQASVGLGDLYARRVRRGKRRRADPPEPYERAMEAYQNAVTVDPKLPEAQLHFALFLDQVGELQEAEQAYRAAAEAAAVIPEKAPDYYAAYGRFIGQRQERWQDAIVQFELARMFRHDDPEIQRELAVAHTRLGQKYFKNISLQGEKLTVEEFVEQYSLAERALKKGYDMFPDKDDPEAENAASTLQQLRSIRGR